jgi:tetratricopeptide (TPR) repeat protein
MLVCALLALAALPPARAQRLGTIDFPTSGAPAAQGPFIRGVLWLHSFEYEAAAAAFREAERLDPGFAMAYWGEALSYSHPVWNQQDANAARAALARLAPTTAGRRAKARTPREQAYLAAVETLYGSGSKAHRDTLYAKAMERLGARFPGDREAKVFYAAALLGLNQGVRDVRTYMRAAAILEPIFKVDPTHPGVLHLLIHCYDDPTHAPLGLAAARAYATVAPDAPHAHHMTTHIFMALGLWDDVVAQNEIASGPDHSAWTPGHYTDWLGYGYLQQGRYGEAQRLLDVVRQNMSRARGAVPAVLAEMRADYVVNTEQWNCPCLTWPIDLTGMRTRDQALDVFVAGLSALRRNDRASVTGSLGELARFRRSAAAAGRGGDPVPQILEQELEALVAQADGRVPAAIQLLRSAAAAEDAIPFEFGPPAVAKPTHELLGEVLLAAGRAREAQVEFERALRLAPKRALSLLGLARAAAAAGDKPTATRAFADLRGIWHGADAGIRGRDEAARGY